MRTPSAFVPTTTPRSRGFGVCVAARWGSRRTVMPRPLPTDDPDHFRAVRDVLDPAREGGALLFGVDGVAVIAHGRSDARAIRNAIRVAKECVEGKAVEAIRALHT